MNTKRISAHIDEHKISLLKKDGKQTPILFLHGWGGSAESWQPLWEQLQIDNTLIAIDFPGFGQSPPPPRVWNVGNYCECVVKYIQNNFQQPIHLVTHSFGGRVAIKLLSQHPELIDKNIFIASAGIKNQSKNVQSISLISKIIKKVFLLPGLSRLFPLVRKFGYRLIGGQDYLAVSGVMKETFQQVIEEDLKPIIGLINTPSLIFWGTHDSYVPLADGKYIAQTIPGAELTIFEDGRHGIHKTHSAQIADKIQEFIK